ncbi:OmpA/MotB domain-containing protein [Croceitalea dokdonensis DOKDO 023]|uniref:OmpA/MotB domain-containing protein n=1 Tax=Croceitalea dokdonensis DOKDO 023 TaxID=1300341 RepID=A0A0N8H3X5_9FLAO|nr:OmpA family protein [Croceitalea dokdonensis]KPM31788.1 OmpA/MotB domain-containing protein [Croceitalea dokdonensis DOKDO 023]
MFKKYLLFFLFLSTLPSVLFAQERVINRANDKYEEYSFKPAIDIYKKVYEKGFESPDLLKRLGNAYYFNAEYKEAAPIYKLLLDKYDSIITPDYVFRYAQALKTIGEYEEARSAMERFAKLTNDTALVKRLSEDYLKVIEENSGRYDLQNFPYNSKYSDFAPSFYKEGLIFSSDRDTGNFARYRHTWNAKDFLDLYKVDVQGLSENKVFKIDALETATQNADLTETETERLPKKKNRINSRFHESTSVVTKDGKTMYFTRNNFLDGKKYKDEAGTTRLKIYQATMIDGTWTNITELPFNSDSYSVAHPALSPDEKMLYFASDMPGSFGESDIFKVQIMGDGTFGTPVNLGATINTNARETFPFVTQKDILYFASDGHLGLGGLDVFATKIAFDEYDQPVVNVGKPINSPYDDFTFIIDEETSEGYFASNRLDGMGEDDIYAFKETSPLRLDCRQQVTGTVRDRISNELLVSAKVNIIDENNMEVNSVMTNEKGEYILELDCNQGNFVRASMEGYIPSEEYLPKSYGKPQIVDFYLERDVVSGGFGDDLAKLLQLSTIYFDLNKYDIRPDAEVEIQKVIAAMEKYPSLKIKVNAHTDSRGNDDYNLWLSEKRAAATVDYMIAKGIAIDRLESEGYGEQKLLNECENGVRCSAEKHQLNRRSEFIILD